MKKKHFYVVTVVILIIVGCSLFYPPSVKAQEVYRDSGETLFFGNWNDSVSKYVENGFVDYGKWKQDAEGVAKTMEQLKKISRGKTARDHLLAAYINAYNVFTVQLIFEYYPNIKSIKDIPGGKRWDDVRWEVGERKVSLNQLEHEILRKEFIEPRIHFAIVCASIGCPHLASTSYEGENLDEQLTKAAKNFFARKENLRIENNTVYVSSILNWFKGDFIRDSLATELKWFGANYIQASDNKRLLMFIARFAPSELSNKIKENYDKWSISYADYDWNLNGK